MTEGLRKGYMLFINSSLLKRNPPVCAGFRERHFTGKQSPSLRLAAQPAPFDKGAYSTSSLSARFFRAAVESWVM